MRLTGSRLDTMMPVDERPRWRMEGIVTTTQSVKLRGKPDRKRAAGGAETMLEEWVTRVEGARPVEAKAAGGAHEGVRAALARVTLEGSLARFDDAVGGTVALGKTDGASARSAARSTPEARIAHAGSIAVRGPLGVGVEALRGTPMTDVHARGAEFVAAWFGAPVDAVTVGAQGGPPRITWGFWSAGHKDLARTLAEWKKSDAASFDAQLGVYGIDVLAPDDDPLAEPKLLVVDPHRGVARGAQALSLLAQDPRRIAVLARGLRDANARAAQVKTVVSWVIAPVFARVVLRADRKVLVGDAVTTPRGAAAILCAARVVDLDALGAMLDVEAPSDDALLRHAARWLMVQGHKVAAHRVRRILSSPELL
jgi:hypothetical protein